jgi:dnd system-associated protein 4
MIDRRISYSAHHKEFIESLSYATSQAGKSTQGFFRTDADVLAFAVAYAIGNKLTRKPLSDKKAEPIRLNVFVRGGYESLFYLASVVDQDDPRVLGSSDEMEMLRGTIFEEYAEAGLGALRSKLKGEVDMIKAFKVLLNDYRPGQTQEQFSEPLNLEKLINS